mgnify:CR=1 FL=1
MTASRAQRTPKRFAEGCDSINSRCECLADARLAHFVAAKEHAELGLMRQLDNHCQRVHDQRSSERLIKRAFAKPTQQLFPKQTHEQCDAASKIEPETRGLQAAVAVSARSRQLVRACPPFAAARAWPSGRLAAQRAAAESAPAARRERHAAAQRPPFATQSRTSRQAQSAGNRLRSDRLMKPRAVNSANRTKMAEERVQQQQPSSCQAWG